MITLRPYQEEAVRLVRSQMKRGGDIRVGMPTGTGRTMIAIEAASAKKAVVYVSRYRMLREQVERMAAELGREVTTVAPGTDLSAFDVVLIDDMGPRTLEVDHPLVVRF